MIAKPDAGISAGSASAVPDQFIVSIFALCAVDPVPIRAADLFPGYFDAVVPCFQFKRRRLGPWDDLDRFGEWAVDRFAALSVCPYFVVIGLSCGQVLVGPGFCLGRFHFLVLPILAGAAVYLVTGRLFDLAPGKLCAAVGIGRFYLWRPAGEGFIICSDRNRVGRHGKGRGRCRRVCQLHLA